MRRRVVVGMVTVAAVAVVLASIGQAPAVEQRRKIFMSAVEYKGGANVADEAYPPADQPGTRALAPLGGGYRLKDPDVSGRWEVSSYRWEPGLLVARVGQRITLEIAGINGAFHDSVLISPSGDRTPFVVTRGRMTRVRFRANEAGFWKLVCSTHPPGMTAEILVLR